MLLHMVCWRVCKSERKEEAMEDTSYGFNKQTSGRYGVLTGTQQAVENASAHEITD